MLERIGNLLISEPGMIVALAVGVITFVLAEIGRWGNRGKDDQATTALGRLSRKCFR